MTGRRCAALCSIALVTITLVAAACGGDDDDDDRTAAPTEAETATPTPEAEPQSFVVRAGSTEGPVRVRAFLPSELTIRVGDSLTWEPDADWHTVSFVADAEPFPLIVPDPSSPADVILNPRVVEAEPSPFPAVFDDSVPFNSGVFGADFGPGPSLTFTRAGSFTYLCLVHPRMEGTVNVVADPAAEIEASAEVEARGDEELDEYLQEAQDALESAGTGDFESAEGPNETRIWQVLTGTSTDHTDIRLFIPNEELQIQAGDTVIWANESEEPHTVTFGEPPPFLEQRTGPDGAMRYVLNPDVLNVALGDFEFVAGEFFHSGLLLTDGPLGVTFQLVFPAGGRFTYVDSLYPDLMMGVIVVSE
jgi:plastocyanin